MSTYEEFYMGEYNRASDENIVLKAALRTIRALVLTDDDGAWDDPYGRLESVLDITTDLKAEGHL